MPEIEDYYQATDNDDWSPAIERAQASWRADNIPGSPRGFALHFQPRTYRFSRSIELIRSMSLIGAGGMAFSGTELEFPDGVTGIICHMPATTPQSLQPGRGDGSIVERLQVNALGNTSLTAHGIVMFAPMSLRDVSIFRFGGNGIHIEAGGQVIANTNADGWQIYNCRVQQCSGDGLFLRGDDANAGCAIGLLCNDNGGWAIQDISRVGNTFIACEAHENGRLNGIDRSQPDYRWAFRCTAETDGSGNVVAPYPSSLFLNCYSEGYSFIAGPAMVIGGYMNVSPNQAVYLRYENGRAAFPFGITGNGQAGPSSRSRYGEPSSEIEPKKIYASCDLGGGGRPTALTLRAYFEDSNELVSGYELMYSPDIGYQGWWSLHQAGQSGSPISFSSSRAPEGEGNVWFQMGYYVGREATGRFKVDVGFGPPPTSDKSKRGDRILNAAPTAGGFEGWICVAAGEPAGPHGVPAAIPPVWKGFGLIEA